MSMNTTNIRQSLYQCLENKCTMSSTDDTLFLCSSQEALHGITVYISFINSTTSNDKDFIAVTFANAKYCSAEYVTLHTVSGNKFDLIIAQDKQEFKYYLKRYRKIDSSVTIRKELKYGKFPDLLTRPEAITSPNTVTLLTLSEENAQIDNGHYIIANDITYVNELYGKKPTKSIIGKMANISTTKLTGVSYDEEGIILENNTSQIDGFNKIYASGRITSPTYYFTRNSDQDFINREKYTGNSATATNATNDSSGSNIRSTYLSNATSSNDSFSLFKGDGSLLSKITIDNVQHAGNSKTADKVEWKNVANKPYFIFSEKDMELKWTESGLTSADNLCAWDATKPGNKTLNNIKTSNLLVGKATKAINDELGQKIISTYYSKIAISEATSYDSNVSITMTCADNKTKNTISFKKVPYAFRATYDGTGNNIIQTYGNKLSWNKNVLSLIAPGKTESDPLSTVEISSVKHSEKADKDGLGNNIASTYIADMKVTNDKIEFYNKNGVLLETSNNLIINNVAFATDSTNAVNATNATNDGTGESIRGYAHGLANGSSSNKVKLINADGGQINEVTINDVEHATTADSFTKNKAIQLSGVVSSSEVNAGGPSSNKWTLETKLNKIVRSDAVSNIYKNTASNNGVSVSLVQDTTLPSKDGCLSLEVSATDYSGSISRVENKIPNMTFLNWSSSSSSLKIVEPNGRNISVIEGMLSNETSSTLKVEVYINSDVLLFGSTASPITFKTTKDFINFRIYYNPTSRSIVGTGFWWDDTAAKMTPLYSVSTDKTSLKNVFVKQSGASSDPKGMKGAVQIIS